MNTDECQRLQTLHDTGLLDTPPEQDFDDLVDLAAQICGVPISLVSLVGEHRQWFKAAVGLSLRETPRKVSFCAHAILQPSLFVVEDATLDTRFADNPLVTGYPNYRFYAGMPLIMPDGSPIGTLCVVDRVSRTLTADQQRSLAILAKQVVSTINLRVQKCALAAALGERDKANAHLQAFMEHSPHAIFLKSEDGRYLFYNRQFSGHFGIDPAAWIGRYAADVLPPELAATFHQDDQEVLRTGTSLDRIESRTGIGGIQRSFRIIRFTYMGGQGDRMLAGISVDVTEALAQSAQLEAANLQLQELAGTDALTGLFNRRAFAQHLGAEFSAARRHRRELSVLMIDVDNFKNRNDRWGHAAGDEVLRRLGGILNLSFRKNDISARYGGEEFAVLLPETGVLGAKELAERFKASIAAGRWEYEDVTVSIGIASLDADMIDEAELVRFADDALYKAKHAGKDCILIRAQSGTQSELAPL